MSRPKKRISSLSLALFAVLVSCFSVAAGTITEIGQSVQFSSFNETTDPGVNDDQTSGYVEGSVWLNTSASPSTFFINVDATAGAAVWKEFSFVTGTGGHPVADSISLVTFGTDKEMRIDVGAVSDSTTRVLTMPDQDVDLTPTTGAFQASDAQLTDIADIAVTDSNFIVGNGTNWVVETGATARTSMGAIATTDIDTSSELAGILTDETGTGLACFATAPTFTTRITSPEVLGGSSTTQDLTLQTTSGVGTTGADMHFLVGNNGATEAMTILNDGRVGIATTPGSNVRLHVKAVPGGTEALRLQAPAVDGQTALSFNDHLDVNQWFLTSRGAGDTPGLRFAFFDNASTEVLTLLQGGNIGIGVNDPQTNLHVKESSTDTVPTVEIEQLSTGDAGLQFSIVGDAFALGVDNTDDSFKISYAAGAGTAVLGTNDRFVIDSSGKVGIGTTAPDELFHTAKAVDGDAILALIENSQANTSASTNETAQIRFGFGGDNDVARIVAGKESDYEGLATENDSFLAFYTDLDGTAAERIRIDSTGAMLLTGANKKIGATDTGSIYIAPFADSTAAFQVREEDNTEVVFNVDTTNGRIGIENATGVGPQYRLDIGNLSYFAVNSNFGHIIQHNSAATTEFWSIAPRNNGDLDIAVTATDPRPTSNTIGSSDNAISIKANKDVEFLGGVNAAMGTSGSFSVVGGVANSQFIDVGNVGLGEDILQTFTLPANALNADGKAIRIKATFVVANNNNVKAVKLHFGATVIASSGPSDLLQNLTVYFDVIVVRTGASAQRSTAFRVEGTGVLLIRTTPAEDTTTAIVIKGTGETTTNVNDDVIQESMLVEFLN